MDVIGAVTGALDYARSSIQAGKNAWQNTSGNFWDKLGAGVGAGMSELFTGEYAEQKELQSTIDAEQRALANTRALRDEENAYNSPEAQAARLKAAGINPMGQLGNPVAASTTQVDSSGGISSKTGPGNMSDLLPLMQFMEQKRVNDSVIDKNKAQAGKLTKETALAEWDVKLKQQMFNYNAENYPILLEAGKQKLANSRQELENLKAKENYDKAAADELRKRIEKEQEEIYLLQLQYYAEEQTIEINTAKLKQMAQDLETGEFNQAYAKWHAKHEQALFHIAETRGKITDQEWTDLWESGLMKDKTETERDHIKQMANKLLLENDIWETGKTGDDVLPQLFRRLMYLLTEII